MQIKKDLRLKATVVPVAIVTPSLTVTPSSLPSTTSTSISTTNSPNIKRKQQTFKTPSPNNSSHSNITNNYFTTPPSEQEQSVQWTVPILKQRGQNLLEILFDNAPETVNINQIRRLPASMREQTLHSMKYLPPKSNQTQNNNNNHHHHHLHHPNNINNNLLGASDDLGALSLESMLLAQESAPTSAVNKMRIAATMDRTNNSTRVQPKQPRKISIFSKRSPVAKRPGMDNSKLKPPNNTSAKGAESNPKSRFRV